MREEDLGSRRGAWRVVRGLGPGVIAGASDNDPTTVATLAVVGASTVYGLAWLVLLLWPMLLVVQVMSARLAVVTGKNLAVLIREHFGPRWMGLVVLLVLGVNLVTIAADLEAGAAALELLTGLAWTWFLAPLTVGLALLVLFRSHRQLEAVLSYVLWLFGAYLAVAVLAHPDWSIVLRHTLVPTWQFTSAYTEGALALLGTTLTSYVYFWQTIEEEAEHRPLVRLPLAQLDAALGITVVAVIFWGILVGTAATLGVYGQSVDTAQDAARALAPLAGAWASGLFGLGLLGSAILALPILAVTSGYVVADAFRWERGLDVPPHRGARRFYAVAIGSLAVGAGLACLGVEPIRLLVVASLLGGLATPVTLALLFRLAGSPDVMGEYRMSGWVAILGWLTAALMTLAGLAYLVQPLLNAS